MKMPFFIMLFISTMNLLGCAALAPAPPSPVTEPIYEGKVAIYVEASKHPKHAHVGTTIFNNFVKTYDSVSWQIEDTIYNKLKDDIEKQTNLTVIDFKELDIPVVKNTDKHPIDFVSYKGAEWIYTPHYEKYKEALAKHNVKAVISIIEQPTVVLLECAGGPCNVRTIPGYGLFTRGLLGLKRYYATAGFGYTFEILKPKVEVHQLRTFKENQHWEKSSSVIKNMKPIDFKNLTDEELQPVKISIVEYMNSMSELVVSYLKNEVDDTIEDIEGQNSSLNPQYGQ